MKFRYFFNNSSYAFLYLFRFKIPLPSRYTGNRTRFPSQCCSPCIHRHTIFFYRKRPSGIDIFPDGLRSSYHISMYTFILYIHHLFRLMLRAYASFATGFAGAFFFLRFTIAPVGHSLAQRPQFLHLS